MINSLFGDGTRSWVRIVNWTDKDVTEMSDEIHIENIGKTDTQTKIDVILYDDSSTVFSAEVDGCGTRTMRGGAKKRFQYCVDPESTETLRYLRATSFWRTTCRSCITRSCTVAERLRVHLFFGKCTRCVLHISFWIDTGWERCQKSKTCSVFCSREPDVRRWARTSWVRSQNCSEQKLRGKYSKTQCIGVNWGLL